VILLELALRLYLGMPVLTLRDWRTLQVTLFQTSGALFDPLLGWTQVPNFAGDGFSTLDYGIRKNSDQDEDLTSEAILAVGDSYTAGSDVVNEDTWPAQLERELGRRVINAGVGGYGVDQTVLNAERLLSILHPRLVLVGVFDDDIIRTSYRSFNAPKPYFVEEGGRWVHKNNPVPRDAASDPEPLYKAALARLLSAHLVLSRDRDYWYSGNGPRYVKVSDTPARTSCYALERLQQKLAAERIPAILVVQHFWWSYSRGYPRPSYVEDVLSCAQALGFTVIDEFDSLSEIAARSIAELQEHYVKSPEGTYGHMSQKGNSLIVKLIAPKIRALVDLREIAPLPSASGESNDGAGINRIIGKIPASISLANATVSTDHAAGALANEPTYRITADASAGEHYAIARWASRTTGPHTFSVYVLKSQEADVTVQLIDRNGNGAFARYVFSSGQFDLVPVGAGSKLQAHQFVVGDGTASWIRLGVTADVLGQKGAAIVKVIPKAGPTGLLVQGLMVEEGSVLSAYCRPRACPAAH
jgi:hypothetical protein